MVVLKTRVIFAPRHSDSVIGYDIEMIWVPEPSNCIPPILSHFVCSDRTERESSNQAKDKYIVLVFRENEPSCCIYVAPGCW